MREIIMMLERELSNDGLIYIYRESDGKWYALSLIHISEPTRP